MSIRRITVQSLNHDTVFEVMCLYGDNVIVYRKEFDTYRRAARHVRSELNSVNSSRRYEVREVHRCELFYAVGRGVPRPARRLIETDYVKGWDMVNKPSKKGGILI